MRDAWQMQIQRRPALRRLLATAGGVAVGLGLVDLRTTRAQTELLTVSGAGVNVKMMPAPDGGPMVPLREAFSVDPYYAQCIIEDNPAAFAMETFAMGRVVIEPHTFFMAMYATRISLVSVTARAGGGRAAKLVGELDCYTAAGTASVTLGSRTAREPTAFEIEAVDGGSGGGAGGDSFAFTVFFDPAEARVNNAIFGPKATFTGEMVAGEITIASPVLMPLEV